jgi:hypothetical protein
MDKLLKAWTISDLRMFILLVPTLSLAIRCVSCVLRAMEPSKSAPPSFRARFVESFQGFPPDPTRGDYWHAFLLGCIEFAAYPILMATGAWSVIGAWLGFKTLAVWKHWAESRPAFNRFLICNALILILSLLLLVRFVQVG